MDYEFMRHITDVQIQKEVDERMTQDAIKKKQIQEKQDKRDAVKAIAVIIGAMLFVGFMGG